jgi:tricorn protease
MLRRTLPFIAALLLFCAAASTDHTLADDIPPAATLAEPGISPDRSEIAFVSGGDVWSVASGGGVARLLADTEGSASRPLF